MQSYELRTLQMESASYGNLHTEMRMRHPEYLIVAALMVYSHSKGKSQKAQKAKYKADNMRCPGVIPLPKGTARKAGMARHENQEPRVKVSTTR